MASGKVEWLKPAKRRLWRKGDDVYEVIKGAFLFGERVGIMRAGFLGEQMYYEVKALRGTRIAILHSSYVKNVSNPVVPIVPSLVSIAVTSFAPDVPPGTLPAASSHVFPPPPPPPPPPPSVSDGNTVGTRTGIPGSRLRSGRSPTSNVQLASGDAAAGRDSRGFLLCEHQKRRFNCSLCLETNKIAQQSKSGSTVVTRDITLATSPASTTGPGSSSTHTPETTVGVTSGVTGRMLGKRQRSPPVIEEPPPKATSAASGPAFCTRAGTDVTGGATSGVTVKDQHRDKWQPPPKVSPRNKAPHPKATSTAAASAFATRAGTEVTGGAKSGVTCKEQLRDKRQPPPKVSPRNKAPPPKATSIAAAPAFSTRAGLNGKLALTCTPGRGYKGVTNYSAGSPPNKSKGRSGGRKGTIQKSIKNDRNKVNRAKICQHQKRKTRCPICVQKVKGGTGSLCKHFKQKGWCIACKSLGGVYYGEARKRDNKDN